MSPYESAVLETSRATAWLKLSPEQRAYEVRSRHGMAKLSDDEIGRWVNTLNTTAEMSLIDAKVAVDAMRELLR